jgi:hypothetical protein
MKTKEKSKEKEYLKLEDVTNIYAQFHLLSKEDKKKYNDRQEARRALRHLHWLLNFRA